MPTQRGENYQSRYDENFKKFLRENLSLDEAGQLKSRTYLQVYIGIKGGGRNSKNIAIPLSHLSWFLSRGEWPRDGYVIDHIDDNYLNNKPDNLQELTSKDNHAKRRGKGNREYGKTKYGHGIRVDHDKRDERWYACRYFSSKDVLELKDRKISLFGASSLEKIEIMIQSYINYGMNEEAAIKVKEENKEPIYKTKYGYGIGVSFKKDKRKYKVQRWFQNEQYMKYLGQFTTLKEAEEFIQYYIENNLNYDALADLTDPDVPTE